MRTRYYGILLLFVLAVAMNAGSGVVSAQSCAAQLGYSTLSPSGYYYTSNIAITVPVLASCSFVGTQLYAVGYAYDASSNRNLGSASTALTSPSGITFTGQLVFNLSPAIIGHQLRVTVLIYNGYASGVALATAAQSLQVTPPTTNPRSTTKLGYATRIYPAFIRPTLTATITQRASLMEAAIRYNAQDTYTSQQPDASN